VKVGDLVLENFEGPGLVITEPYKYYANKDFPRDLGCEDYDVVVVKFAHGTFEMDCDELEMISESR